MNNSPDNLDADQTSDLEWLAFQYVANELPEQECLQFEALLAEKQSAREALAHATQLVAGLKSIAAQPVGQDAVASAQQPETTTTTRWAFWGLLTTAAAVVLLVPSLFKSTGTTDNPTIPTAQTEPSTEDAEYLLSLWAESSQESNVALTSNMNTETVEFSDQQNVLADNQSLEVPDWLYTAVSLPEESVN
ncbi:hypothetical protein [Gimesia chilikensis]|uniref:hypothetical protein n=1 Tax=Gimesia chilikensis TaxID=2605989 RepID=UPI003A953687